MRRAVKAMETIDRGALSVRRASKKSPRRELCPAYPCGQIPCRVRRDRPAVAGPRSSRCVRRASC